jgi:hypothetical protein
MTIDPANPVVALCAAGMERDGVPEEAMSFFERAWAARRDDYDAAIAAHYLARHQPTPDATHHWNALAVAHAERVPRDRISELLPSLYLNHASSLATLEQLAAARRALDLAAEHLAALPDDGYRAMLSRGIDRLRSSLHRAGD